MPTAAVISAGGAVYWQPWGVSAGSLVHVFAAAFGLSALLAGSSNAFIIIKLVGGLYLVYVGLCMLLKNPTSNNNRHLLVGISHHKTIFYQGFLTNALNPKVALFFIAFVPQFIAADAPNLRLSFLFLGFIFSFNGLVWCLIVAWFFAHIGAQLNPLSPISLWINRLAGSLLAYFGISLLMSSGH